MKPGSKTKLTKPTTPAGSVGNPERDLAYEKPLAKPEKPDVKEGFVRMGIIRAFQLKSEATGEIYGGKEGDIVDVPTDVAVELDREFETYFNHDGLINKKNAKRTVIKRAFRV